jgi:hypothetical protein
MEGFLVVIERNPIVFKSEAKLDPRRQTAGNESPLIPHGR